MHNLSPDDLATEDGKKLLAYLHSFDSRLIAVEHRIAANNQFATQAYLKPHEDTVFEERLK